MDILSPVSSGRDRFRMLRHCMVYESYAKVSFKALLCNPLIPAFSPGRRSLFILQAEGLPEQSTGQRPVFWVSQPIPSAVDVCFLVLPSFHQAEPDEAFFSCDVLLACPKSTKRTSLNRALQQKLRVKFAPPFKPFANSLKFS